MVLASNYEGVGFGGLILLVPFKDLFLCCCCASEANFIQIFDACIYKIDLGLIQNTPHRMLLDKQVWMICSATGMIKSAFNEV